MSEQGLVPRYVLLGARHSTPRWLTPQVGSVMDVRISFHLKEEALTPTLHRWCFPHLRFFGGFVCTALSSTFFLLADSLSSLPDVENPPIIAPKNIWAPSLSPLLPMSSFVWSSLTAPSNFLGGHSFLSDELFFFATSETLLSSVTPRISFVGKAA